MTAAALVTLATLLLEDDYLVVLLVLEDGCLYGGTFNKWAAETCVCTFAEHEHFVELNGVAFCSAWERVYLKDVTFCDCKLAALCSDCRFHGLKFGKGEEKSVLSGEIKKFLAEFINYLRGLRIEDLPSYSA